MAIINNLINTSNTLLYQSTGDSCATVMYFCNHNATSVTVQIYAVESGGVATIQNQLYKDLVIPSGDTFVLDTEKLILSNGDKLVASADVSAQVSSTVVYVSI